MATTTEPTLFNEVFVSYSRKNGVFAQKIVQAIYDSGRENVWIDWEDIEYAEDWWQKIQAGIDSADNFIFILTPDSARSKVCFNEVDYAVKSGKRIIPVEYIPITEQSDFEQMHPNVSAHNWLPFTEEDHFYGGMKQLINILDTDLRYVKLHTRLLVRARDWETGDKNPSFLLTGAEIDSAETWLTEAILHNRMPSATNLHHDYIIAGRERDLADKKQIRNLRWTVIGTGTIAVIAIIILIIAGFLAVDLPQRALANFQIASANRQIASRNTQIASGNTQIASAMASVNTQIASEMASANTQIASANRQIAELEPHATMAAIFLEPLKSWIPLVEDINGVEMVRVPAGCFAMGSNENSHEQPIHVVCIEEDFWIDQYEVTNEQFETLDGVAENPPLWDDTKKPRTWVTWFEAQAFCELRGGNLPTEAQWEYAARGPDNLIYPWGDGLIGENAKYSENSNNAPSIVGSRSGGVSWIGAYDMSGNAMEWTSSIYENYPYDANDGRENLEDESSDRVLRGGSFRSTSNYLRSAIRNLSLPNNWIEYFGFRCVVSVPVQE